MKKLIYLIALIVALAFIITGCVVPVVPPIEQNELTVSKTIVSEGVEYNEIVNSNHKIINKWDLKGSFIAIRNWGLSLSDPTWNYEIHIKEAMEGDFSVGTICFNTTANDGTEIEVIGHVKQTKNNYAYWWGSAGHPQIRNLAAAGIAEYNGVTYNFLFLFNENAMWFTVSQENIENYWNASPETVWPGSLRIYELHSIVSTGQFIMEPKEIH